MDRVLDREGFLETKSVLRRGGKANELTGSSALSPLGGRLPRQTKLRPWTGETKRCSPSISFLACAELGQTDRGNRFKQTEIERTKRPTMKV